VTFKSRNYNFISNNVTLNVTDANCCLKIAILQYNSESHFTLCTFCIGFLAFLVIVTLYFSIVTLLIYDWICHNV